jgi:putative SOS response-associated peptidase YedK
MESETEAATLKWGLAIGGSGMAPINARVESAASKPTFRDSWKLRRCLLPADGWFEWKAEEGGKQPYYFTPLDGEPIFFAGLWTGETYCMFTTAADGLLTAVHHRKPLALAPDDAKEWLRRPMETDVLIHQAVRAEAFKVCPVSKAVSNWRNDGPEMIEPITLVPAIKDTLF